MTFTIGRVTFPVDPARVSHSGDSFRFTLQLLPATAPSLYALQALRQQVIGLINPDEEVTAVTWSQDSTYDGFYRVTGVTVPDDDMMIPGGRILNCTIDLERVPGYANPWFELTTQSVVRTNAHGITAPSTIIATGPAVAVMSNELVDLYPDLGGATASPTRKISNGYDLRCYRDPAPQSVTAVRYSALASSFHLGAALLEIKYGGTWYTVNGPQMYDISATVAGGAPVSQWRISNGLVRLTSTSSSSSSGSGTFEIWDNTAGAWESVSVSFNGAGGPGNYGPRAIVKAPVVLRNSAEQVTVRVQTAKASETWTIQRGAHFVTCSLYDPVATTFSMGLASAGTAGTSITGGVRETSNNASGNRTVFGLVAGAVGRTADTANTRVTTSSTVTSATFMIGSELDGSSAAAGNAAADLIDQFVGAVSWRQRIVRQ